MARELVATTTTDEHRLRMGYEEYLDWSDEDTHAEWVDGEVIVFMPVTLAHQLLVGFWIGCWGSSPISSGWATCSLARPKFVSSPNDRLACRISSLSRPRIATVGLASASRGRPTS